jgi:hypothetical protein
MEFIGQPNVIVRRAQFFFLMALSAALPVVAASPPTITGTPPASVVAGHAYAFKPTAKGPAGSTLSFSIAHKPSWGSFSIATGELSGTPTTAEEGKYSDIKISVSSGTATAALPDFSIAVTAPYTKPTISGVPAKSVIAGQAYEFEPQASVEAGKTANFSITDKPTWASFSATTGELSGTPAAANVGTDSNIVIRVTDGTTTVALPAFAIAVTEVGTKSATLSWKAPTSNSNGCSAHKPRRLPHLLRHERHGSNALDHDKYHWRHDGCSHRSESRHLLLCADGGQYGGH